MKVNTWDDMPAGSVLWGRKKLWIKASGGFVASDMTVYRGGMDGPSSFNIREWGGLKYFPMQYLT